MLRSLLIFSFSSSMASSFASKLSENRKCFYVCDCWMLCYVMLLTYQFLGQYACAFWTAQQAAQALAQEAAQATDLAAQATDLAQAMDLSFVEEGAMCRSVRGLHSLLISV